MKSTLRLLIVAAIGTAAYFAGAQSRPMEATPLPAAEPRLKAEPLDLTIANPTAVLLGEAKVPNELLKGPVSAAPDLIVPDLPK